MDAVIMAGGLGTRLRPLTYAIPKPLIPIGDKPILEILLGQLGRAGLDCAYVATGYKGDLIKSYFGNGSRVGVAVRYIEKTGELGTAGALRLVCDQLTEPFLIINGDILTRLDFADFHRAHVDSGADFTAAAVRYDVHIPYGVIESNGAAIAEIVEKPTETRLILAGIYAANPSVLTHVPEGRPSDVPHLIRAIVKDGGRVRRHEINAFWLDVGRMDDFEAALKAVESWDEL